jgi:hypothetical protein
VEKGRGMACAAHGIPCGSINKGLTAVTAQAQKGLMCKSAEDVYGIACMSYSSFCIRSCLLMMDNDMMRLTKRVCRSKLRTW